MITKLKPLSCNSSMSLDSMVLTRAASMILGGNNPIRQSTEQTSMRRVSVAGSPRRAENEKQSGVLHRANPPFMISTTSNRPSIPPGHSNKGKKVIGSFCHAEVHPCIELPIIDRLIDQGGIDGANPTAVCHGAGIGGKFDVGAKFLGNRMPQANGIGVVKMGSAPWFVNRLNDALDG